MNIRRLVLDVDKAISKPTVPELAEAICRVEGVEAVNITVTEIDIETVGFNVTIPSRVRISPIPTWCRPSSIPARRCTASTNWWRAAGS